MNKSVSTINGINNNPVTVGIICLIVPVISILIILLFPKKTPELLIEIYFVYLLICAIASVVCGIILLKKYFQNKSLAVLLLSLLNIISPIWLIFLFAMAIVSKFGMTFPMMIIL